jgi:4-hydroxybenzoate polyprenyltransferase
MKGDMNTPAPDKIPDAAKANWVDLYAPANLRPWLRLGRFDRPVGIWLLYWPGAMGIMFTSVKHHYDLPWGLLIAFFIGSALMRAAGCAFNDLVDRDIDAQVERTRSRPIPSGQITPKQAVGFIIGCSLISFMILIQLGWLAIGLGVASLGLVAAYPFMKRITWWPQAWLGLTFNWGALMGYAALTGRLDAPILVFYAGLVLWTIGYDTIYALQDIEDDAMIGVKSSARALGASARKGVGIFYALALGLTTVAVALAGLSPLVYIGLAATGAHLTWQFIRLKPEDVSGCLRLFKSNRETGLLWVLALSLGYL